MRKLTRGQIKGHAANHAKGRLHWNMARDASDEGLTKQQAAERCGLSLDGFNTLLRRNAGTQRWPIEGADNGASA